MLHVLNIYPYLCQKYNYELVQKGVDKIIKTEAEIAYLSKKTNKFYISLKLNIKKKCQ